MANPALTYLASEGRDIANLLAIEAGHVLVLSALDARIREASATWIPGKDQDARTSTWLATDDDPAEP